MMKPTELGELLATRTFEWKDDAGVARNCYLDLSHPVYFPPESDDVSGCWRCCIQTRETGEDLLLPAFGGDAMQAIHLALCLAGTIVKVLSFSSKLEDAKLPNFGFPPMEDYSHVNLGDDD
jgi:hypothetical protein